jgi:hypothetical protein
MRIVAAGGASTLKFSHADTKTSRLSASPKDAIFLFKHLGARVLKAVTPSL